MLRIYTKQDCPNCEIVKNHCLLRGISYIEIHLNTKEALDEFKLKYPNVRVVPYVLDDIGPIGGFSAFKTWLHSQKGLLDD